jgi:hypothetical protein
MIGESITARSVQSCPSRAWAMADSHVYGLFADPNAKAIVNEGWRVIELTPEGQKTTCHQLDMTEVLNA